MARPTSITDEQILDAARALFLEHGLETSTAAIAKEAGVSEGSIFKRFKTKEQLFHRAMGLPELDVAAIVKGRAGRGDVRRQLVEISAEIVRFFRVLMPRMLRLWAHCGVHPMLDSKDGRPPPPVRAHQALSEYVAAEMEAGRLRKADPRVVARMWIGALHSFVFVEVIGVEPVRREEDFASDVVDVLLRGIAP